MHLSHHHRSVEYSHQKTSSQLVHPRCPRLNVFDDRLVTFLSGEFTGFSENFRETRASEPECSRVADGERLNNLRPLLQSEEGCNEMSEQYSHLVWVFVRHTTPAS